MRDKDEQTTSFLYCYHWLNCRRRIVSFYATATGKADNDMAPLQQKLVVVSNKREKPINDRRSRQQEVTPAGTSMRYEASFKPQSGGMEQTFRLDAQQYHALTVGDKGTLSYKGTRFVSFVGEQ
ncbi:putative receptor [Escherichia coli]|uniref:Putative receptor n=10 Tax=root TaxID=1 RepID=A0A376TX60_ECOLX|nr:putative receptor [Escherichia coli]